MQEALQQDRNNHRLVAGLPTLEKDFCPLAIRIHHTHTVVLVATLRLLGMC